MERAVGWQMETGYRVSFTNFEQRVKYIGQLFS